MMTQIIDFQGVRVDGGFVLMENLPFREGKDSFLETPAGEMQFFFSRGRAGWPRVVHALGNREGAVLCGPIILNFLN